MWLQRMVRFFVDFSYDLISPDGYCDFLMAFMFRGFLVNVQGC